MPGSKIARDEQLRYLGWRGQELTAELTERLDAMAARCLAVSGPRTCCRVYDVEETADGIAVGGVALLGDDIRHHLHGAAKCAVLAATLGLSVERELRRLEVVSVTDALCFNAACTCLIESVTDACEAAVIADAGLVPSTRYSPGYGDFPLSQQRDILRLSGGDKILGITLTDGDLMVPRKSVTALLPLFPQGTVLTRTRTCSTCNNREICEYRKAGVTCGG